MTVEEIKDCCKLWVKSCNYSNLTNVEGDFDDLAGFQSAIGDEYEAFVLGAYIHSGTSFKTGDHRCRFDSETLGFIGVPKDKIAEELTAAWNGEYEGYEIYDNLTDDYVDSICDYDYKNGKKKQEKNME